MKEHSGEFSITGMCRFMGVSKSGYYGWLKRCPTAREKADAELTPVIRAIFAKSRATYGTRRIRQSLHKQNLSAGRRRIGRLMRTAGLACKTKRKFKVTTDSKHHLPVAENLLDRQFTVQKPNQVYVGDITYVHTQEGWLYLAVVIDLYSRQVVGWSMAAHMKAQLVNNALLMAIYPQGTSGNASPIRVYYGIPTGAANMPRITTVNYLNNMASNKA
jgi:transposase InsO family protein